MILYDRIIYQISGRAPEMKLWIRLWTWHTWMNNWWQSLENTWMFSHVGFSKISHKILPLTFFPTRLNPRTKMVDLPLNYIFCSLFLLCFYNDSQACAACCSTKNLNSSHKSLKPGNPSSRFLMTLSGAHVVICRNIVDAFSNSCYLRNCGWSLPLNYPPYPLPNKIG